MKSGLVQIGLDVFLDHHILADHAARFAHVELVRPVAGVDELIFGQTPICPRRRGPRPGSAGR